MPRETVPKPASANETASTLSLAPADTALGPPPTGTPEVIAASDNPPRLAPGELGDLQQEIQRLRALFAAVPDLIARFSRDGTYLDFVEAKDVPVLVSRDERIGYKVWDVLPADVAREYLSAIHAALDTGKTQTFRYGLMIRGYLGYYEARVVGSGADEALMVIRDITKQQSLEDNLRAEKDRSDKLLLNILPRAVIEELKQGAGFVCHRYEAATVLFADIVGFTEAASELSPHQVVETLNLVFSEFDHFANKLGLEKIKTIGDAYLVVAGVPVPRIDHAQAIAEMALQIRYAVKRHCFPGHPHLLVRIGVSSGPVVAGVIGVNKFAYDVWGDTVNVASRMEQLSDPGEVMVSTSTYNLLYKHYLLVRRGRFEIKGKGMMDAFFLQGRR